MKTYCKNIDPFDINSFRPYIEELICDKYKRRDYSKFIAQFCGCGPAKIRSLEKEDLSDVVWAICVDIKYQFEHESFDFEPVCFSKRIEGPMKKERIIGIECIMQQCVEHAVVGMLNELWQKKFEYHQYATIKGKGQVKGAKQIQKWIKEMRKRGPIYFVKLDIRKCFLNIDHEVVMLFLSRDIHKNNELLRIVNQLLMYHSNGNGAPNDKGMIIGSLLSQFVCNYLLSYAMRYGDSLHKTRRQKSIKMIKHQLYYMDDILLIGTNKHDLYRAGELLSDYIRNELRLEIKPNWVVKNIQQEPIDMMGYRIFANGRMDMRPHIFKTARRRYLRVYDKKMTVHDARSNCAYYGYFKHSRISKLKRCDGSYIQTKNVKKQSAEIISRYDKELI